MKSYLSGYLILLQMELKSLRKDWPWVIGLSGLYPLSLLFLLKFQNHSSDFSGFYLLSGSLVFALTLTTALSLGQEISNLRETSSFDFFATLPVSRAQIVGAILIRSIILSLPSLLIIGVIGTFVLGLHPALRWVFLVPVLIASSLSLASIGAFIGFYSPSARFANLATQALYLVVVFFSPVMFPSSTLPRFLRWLSLALPTTYAADALRQILSGVYIASFPLSLAALSVFAILSAASLKLGLNRIG